MRELLRRAAASVDRGQVKLIPGSFRPVQPGRTLTRLERGLMLLLAGGLGLAVWLYTQSAPISAHAAYYQSLAMTARLDSSSPGAYTESILLASGSDWRPATLFACAHPAFWNHGPAVHPNARARRIEAGLTRLAEHGPVLRAKAFNTPSPVGLETINGVVRITCRVAGQLELADGIVARFAARLVQDGQTKHWGIVDLSIPPFVP
ncbi:MAG: hypothetical protein EXS42_00705 [Lacunisphaera sp.]|nr:hypothetical protein [Lacunisphaera sp.]